MFSFWLILFLLPNGPSKDYDIPRLYYDNFSRRVNFDVCLYVCAFSGCLYRLRPEGASYSRDVVSWNAFCLKILLRDVRSLMSFSVTPGACTSSVRHSEVSWLFCSFNMWETGRLVCPDSSLRYVRPFLMWTYVKTTSLPGHVCDFLSVQSLIGSSPAFALFFFVDQPQCLSEYLSLIDFRFVCQSFSVKYSVRWRSELLGAWLNDNVWI